MSARKILVGAVLVVINLPQMNISHWNKAADENGVIVVYPAGTGTGLRT